MSELTDIGNAVAQAIYDEMEGTIADQDFRRQREQWELSIRLARVAMHTLAVVAHAPEPATAPPEAPAP